MSIKLTVVKKPYPTIIKLVEVEDEDVPVDELCSGCLTRNSKPHVCGMCYNCCNCLMCRECHELVTLSTCTACNLCRNCCKCYACTQCGAPHTHASTLCNRCGGGLSGSGCGCCIHQNRSENPIYFKSTVNLAQYNATSPKELGLNPSSRLISAEMEICGTTADTKPLIQLLKAWKCSVVSDGSLPSGGFEINTHPASGDYFIAQINDICKGLKEAKAFVDYHAGCHTHVDARDLGYLGIARAMRLIACIEPALFMMIPGPRRTSSFCNLWATNYLKAIHSADCSVEGISDKRKQTIEYRNAITKTLYGKTDTGVVQEVRQSKGHSMRYRAVNLHSWFYRGTIEFRMPPGTIYESNVINWGLLLANIVDLAATRSLEEILQLTRPVERYICDHGMYGRTIGNITPKQFDMSIELLKIVAPSKEVREWIVERIALMKRNYTHKENY